MNDERAIPALISEVRRMAEELSYGTREDNYLAGAWSALAIRAEQAQAALASRLAELEGEVERLREAVRAEIAQRNAFIEEVNSVLPPPNGLTCKERIMVMQSKLAAAEAELSQSRAGGG